MWREQGSPWKTSLFLSALAVTCHARTNHPLRPRAGRWPPRVVLSQSSSQGPPVSIGSSRREIWSGPTNSAPWRPAESMRR